MTKAMRQVILTVAGVFVLYTLAGFFLVPYIAKQQGQKILQEKLGTSPAIEKIKFNPFTFKATILGFDLPEADARAGEGSRLKFSEFTLQLILYPLFNKEIRFKLVAIKDLSSKFVVFPDNTTNWAMKSEPAPSSEEKDKGKPWILTLKNLEIDRSGMTIIDKTHVQNMNLPLGPFSLRAHDLSTSLGSETALQSLDILVGETGHLKIHGTFSPSPLAANLNLDFTGLPLDFVSAYLSDVTTLALKKGMGDLKGQLKYDNGLLSVNGEAAVQDILIGPIEGEEEVVSWKLMNLKGVEFTSKPLQLQVQEISLFEPKTKIVLEKDGRLNFGKYLRAEKVNPAEKEAASTAKTSPEPSAEAQSKFQYNIGSLTIEKGILDYADLTIRPNFSVHVHNVNGTLKPISPDPTAKMNVNLNGQIEAYGKFKGKGFYIPGTKQATLNFDMNFHNIELTTFTPYSGHFAGYEISKGKMFLDINYTLVGTRIKGKNKILLDQFTLGDRIESEKASGWPLKFALALAKDRRGQIKFQLPVEGDTKDPSFGWGNLIWTALKNLVVKIVAAPFDFIASLVDGGKDMQWVYFEPGTSTLRAGEEEKIKKLAEVLVDRPELALEIKGEFQEEDIEALKLKAVENRRSKNTEGIVIPDDQLRDLGLARGNIVMGALAKEKIETERMYLLAGSKGEAGKEPHVKLDLKDKK